MPFCRVERQADIACRSSKVAAIVRINQGGDSLLESLVLVEQQIHVVLLLLYEVLHTINFQMELLNFRVLQHQVGQALVGINLEQFQLQVENILLQTSVVNFFFIFLVFHEFFHFHWWHKR